MKKLLLPVLSILMSCGASTKIDNAIVISDLDSDFPVTDTISLSLRQTFEILPKILDCKTIDSVLYVAEDSNDNCGHCYNINTGEQISTIVTRGKANNEMLSVDKLLVVGDSIQLLDTPWQTLSGRLSIRTYAHKDFLTKGVGERDFSTLFLPDSIRVVQRIKTPQGEVFGTTPNKFTGLNEFRFFSYGDNGTTYFGEVLKKLVEMKNGLNEKSMVSLNSFFSCVQFACCDSRIAAAQAQGIMLQVIDTKQKRVERGKYYDKYFIEEMPEGSVSYGSKSGYNTLSVGCTKENIFCHVVKKFEENGESVYKSFVFVFDWELNPVKKFYVANNIDGDLFWFSSDCKSIYHMDINAEKQELFEGKIVL